MSVENRQHPRYSVALRAEVTLEHQTVGAETENISAGGVALALDLPLDEGLELDVTLILTQDGIEDPHEEPFAIRAVVAWAGPRPSGGALIGLRFIGATADQRHRLERFLARLS